MPSRKTYKWSASSKKYKEDKDGKFDADGDEITTYRWNSKGKFIRDIDGKLDEHEREVTKYKYCFEEGYFRRDVGGTYNQKYVNDVLSGAKLAPKKSNLTAGFKQQQREARHQEDEVASQNRRDRLAGAAVARQSGNRGESSRTSTAGDSDGQPRTTSTDRRGGSPRGRVLDAEAIDEQDDDDAAAVALYDGDGPVIRPQRANARTSRPNPPGYGEYRKDPELIERAGLFAGGPLNRDLPGYSSQPSSAPGPTGQTPKLSTRVSINTKSQATFGGRYDPNAPPSYSSDESKRGNKSITSGSDRADHEYPSNSEHLSKWYNSEDQKSSPEGKIKPSSVHKPKASSKKEGSSKAAELPTTKKSSAGKAPTNNPFTPRSLSGDSLLGDTDDSPPKFLAQKGRSRTGDRGSSKRESSKRETSEERRRGKLPVGTKEDPAKGSSSRRRPESSDPDRR